MGAVTRDQVDRALSRQQEGYLALVAGLAEGTFGFEPGDVPPWTSGVRIAPLRAIVSALEQPQAARLVDAALAPVGTPLRLAPGYADLAEAFGWTPAEAALVGRLDALPALEAFFAGADVPAARARAILGALVLLGLVAGPGVAEPADDRAVPELLELASEDLVAEPEPAGPAPAVRPEREEERQRRQRLLQRAIQNMGVAPLAGRRPPAPPPAPEARAEAPAPAAPRDAPTERELRASVEAMIARARDPDLFARLGVARTASREDVRNAYFQLAKRFHPDRFHSPEFADLQPRVQDLFTALNQAYQVLSDDRRRAEHAAGAAARPSPDASAAALDFQKAEACLRTRDLARARGFYEAAIRGDPRPEHLAGLAWLLATEGDAADHARAKQLLGQALRDGRSARAAYVAALIARRERNDEAAEKQLRAALALEPGHADALRELRELEARRARRDRRRD
jgi:curved DNA-binding protein CbpA